MGAYVVRTSSLNDKHSCQLFQNDFEARHCFARSSVSDDLFFSSCSFMFNFLLYLYRVLSLASFPGPFTRAVRAGREIRAWYQSFAHALNFTGILVK